MGLSHIADPDAGHRWDCFLLPGFHRRSVIAPYGLRENRWHWWSATPDLSSYTIRYELEWRDRVFVDFTVSGEGSAGRLLTARCVNDTAMPQTLDLHLAANLEINPLAGSRVELPHGAIWKSALEYCEIEMASARHRLQQVADARRPGQVLHPGAASGKAIGGAFFHQQGDAVTYVLTLEAPVEDAVLLLRYHRWTKGPAAYQLSGLVHTTVDLGEQTAGFAACVVPLASVAAGEHKLRMQAIGGEPLIFEGMAIVAADQIQQLKFHSATPASQPLANWYAGEQRLALSYHGLSQDYDIVLLTNDVETHVRHVSGSDVGAIISERANDFHHLNWQGEGSGAFSVLSLGPLFLAPGQTQDISIRVLCRDPAVTAQTCRQQTQSCCQPASQHHTKDRFAGFEGIGRLAAITAANVVYPVHHRDKWIRHYTPGRCWDSLYTWDSGMIGVGLAALDPVRACDSLATYLLPEGDPYAAWVEHGTPLPTQAYQFLEIYNRTGDDQLLRWAYPRFRQWYELLAGRSRFSTTAKFASGLLQTWDYFYNSGGWDDYPPQWYLREHPDLRQRVAPVVTTAHAIRFAKILQGMAKRSGHITDIDRYGRDIERWSMALQTHAWDESSGYFSYVEHDQHGQPVRQLLHESGSNFNCGLDGVSPLIAAGLPSQQVQRLLENLFSSDQLWTPFGLSTVAQSAPYYRDSGYWNGGIWIPHQYLIWKALLDHQQGEQAARLAKAMIDCWEREAAATYHSFEHFRVRYGRGSGWHQFSGLSAPLLAVHAAYFTPGSLTGGFDTWIDSVRWNSDLTTLDAQLDVLSPQGSTIIICFAQPPQNLRIICDGTEMAWVPGLGNSVYCHIPGNATSLHCHL